MSKRSPLILFLLLLACALAPSGSVQAQTGPSPVAPDVPPATTKSPRRPGLPNSGMLKALKPGPNSRSLPAVGGAESGSARLGGARGGSAPGGKLQVTGERGAAGGRQGAAAQGAPVGGGVGGLRAAPGAAGGAAGAGAGAGAAGAGAGPAAAGGGARPAVREDGTGEVRIERDARCIPWKEGELREFNYRDKEIMEVVEEIAQNFCQNFIIPPSAKRGGKITILSFKKVDRGEAWRAFLAALNANKMTVVPAGAYLKLMQQPDAKTEALELYGPDKAVPDAERLVIRLIPLQYVDATEMAAILTKLKSAGGDIVPYPRTNSLIVTDNGTIIRQFLEILRYLDVPGGTDRIWIYQVQFGAAAELAQVLEQIFDTKGAGKPAAGGAAGARAKRPGAAAAAAAPSGGGGEEAAEMEISKIIADERTNMLIILSTERAFNKVMEVLRHLDVNVAGEGQVHVYYLRNADAEEISGVLQGVATGQGGAQQAGGRRRQAGVAAGAKAGAAGAAGGNAAGGAAVLFEGDVKITADKATNSLVVIASNQDYASLVRVIEMLDIRRPQVFVEAVIMEVNISKTRELGMALHGGKLFNVDGQDVPLLAGTNMKSGSLNSLLVNPLSLMGLGVALRGPTLEGSGSLLGLSADLPSLGLVLSALQTNDDVNILSTPHILTTDNQEAEIEVGQNVPFIAGSMGGSSGLGSLSALGGLGSLGSSATSALGGLGSLSGLLGGSGYGGYNIQRQDVSLKLKINPHINESDFVRLELEQTIEELGADNPGLGPTTTKRAVKTTVVARDQQTVVIGGLMRDNTIEGVEKVPFLGDIPILGYLFRTSKHSVQKQNLLLLLTPYIIRDPSDFRAIFLRKMKEREDFIEQYSHVLSSKVNIPVNYDRKHGMLEEVHQLVGRAKTERAERERAVQELKSDQPLFQEIGGGSSQQQAPAGETPPSQSGAGAPPPPSGGAPLAPPARPGTDATPAPAAPPAGTAPTPAPAPAPETAPAPAPTGESVPGGGTDEDAPATDEDVPGGGGDLGYHDSGEDDGEGFPVTPEEIGLTGDPARVGEVDDAR